LAEYGGMGKQRRSAADIRRMVQEFQSSGETRREFCQRHHIPVTTLDYWRRRAQPRPPRLVEVEVAASEPSASFTLSLANGRRIESSWRFADAELVRLIRIAESA
jgi:transposase-like protein